MSQAVEAGWTCKGFFKEICLEHTIQAKHTQIFGQYTINLGKRTFDSGSSHCHPQSPRRQESQRERQRLVLGKHQWRHFEAAEQAIGAVAPTLRLDWDT